MYNNFDITTIVYYCVRCLKSSHFHLKLQNLISFFHILSRISKCIIFYALLRTKEARSSPRRVVFELFMKATLLPR